RPQLVGAARTGGDVPRQRQALLGRQQTELELAEIMGRRAVESTQRAAEPTPDRGVALGFAAAAPAVPQGREHALGRLAVAVRDQLLGRDCARLRAGHAPPPSQRVTATAHLSSNERASAPDSRAGPRKSTISGARRSRSIALRLIR